MWIPTRAERQTAYVRHQLEILASYMLEPVDEWNLNYKAEGYILCKVAKIYDMVHTLDGMLDEVQSEASYP